jgi:proline dehydrogenase
LILGTNSGAIKRFIESIETEARALIKEVSTLSVWASTSTDSVWLMTYLERQILSEVIKERTEAMYGKKGFARSRF